MYITIKLIIRVFVFIMCPTVFKGTKKNKIKQKECLQHVVFPSGHPSKY